MIYVFTGKTRALISILKTTEQNEFKYHTSIIQSKIITTS